jgi:hypothetical protein
MTMGWLASRTDEVLRTVVGGLLLAEQGGSAQGRR